jgi:hypothetical protein
MLQVDAHEHEPSRVVQRTHVTGVPFRRPTGSVRRMLRQQPPASWSGATGQRSHGRHQTRPHQTVLGRAVDAAADPLSTWCLFPCHQLKPPPSHALSRNGLAADGPRPPAQKTGLRREPHRHGIPSHCPPVQCRREETGERCPRPLLSKNPDTLVRVVREVRDPGLLAIDPLSVREVRDYANSIEGPRVAMEYRWGSRTSRTSRTCRGGGILWCISGTAGMPLSLDVVSLSRV